MSVVAALGFGVLQVAMDKLMQPFFWHVCKEKDDDEIRRVRVEKASVCFYKMVYYMGMVIAEYVIMIDEPWFPWYLGGKGNDLANELEYRHLGTNPFNPQTPYLNYFYQAQIGYRLADLFILLFLKKKRANDHNEMLLHHIVALALVVCSYLTNILPIGALVMTVHDHCDIWTSMMRMVGETHFYTGVLAKVFYGTMIVTWVYNRMILLPYLAYVLGFLC